MEKTAQQPAQNTPAVPKPKQPKRPNETSAISVEGFVKIFDPNTKETFVEKRA
jgi:hypothetical protein